MVVWPQYATPAQWAKDVVAVVERLRFDPLQVIGPAAVFSGAVAVIAGVTAITGEPGPALAYGGLALGILWLGAGVTIIVAGPQAPGPLDRHGPRPGPARPAARGPRGRRPDPPPLAGG